MSSFLTRHAAQLLARDLAADDSHAIRPDNTFVGGRIGREHLREFVNFGVSISPDLPKIKIQTASDVRAHVLSIALHPETMAAYVQEANKVMLLNASTLTFAVHNGRPDLDKTTGLINIDGGTVFPLDNRKGSPLPFFLRTLAREASLGPDFDPNALAEAFLLAQDSGDPKKVRAARHEIMEAVKTASQGKVVIAMSRGLEALAVEAPDAILSLVRIHEALPAIKAAQIARAEAQIDPIYADFAAAFSVHTELLKEAGGLSRSLKQRKSHTDSRTAKTTGEEKQKYAEESKDLRQIIAAITKIVSETQKSLGETKALRDELLVAIRDGKDSNELQKSYSTMIEEQIGRMEALKSLTENAGRKYAPDAPEPLRAAPSSPAKENRL